MSKPDFKNEPFRWNRWFASEYDSEAVNIADDFYILDKECDYALLSAQYMVKNQNGKKPDPCFSPSEILATSKKAGFEVDPCARVIDGCWKSYVRWKLELPPVIITPPPPIPPPVVVEKPKKLPTIELPQQPKPASKPPWKLIATILAGVAVVLKFTPAPAFVILIVDWLVKLIAAIPQ